MRTLDHALVYARSKGPLEELLVLNLSNAGLTELEGLGSACTNLLAINASNNKLSTLPQEFLSTSFPRLWYLDLSSNIISSLSSLISTNAFGYLNLSSNPLSYKAISQLRGMHIIRLDISLPPAENKDSDWRSKIIALLPHIWILNGHFITSTERQAASTLHDSSFVADIVSQSSDTRGVYNGWHNPVTKPSESLFTEWIDIFNNLPTKSTAVDIYKLRHLQTYHQHYVKTLTSSASSFSSIQKLSHSRKLDLCILLSAKLEFSIPTNLLSEAMTIHFAGSIRVVDIQQFVNLEPYAITMLLHTLWLQAMDEINSEKPNEMHISDRQIWKNMPMAIVVGKESLNRKCEYYRAVSLLSRSPSFPNMASKGLSDDKMRKTYKALLPLLLAAEMTRDELQYNEDNKSSSVWYGAAKDVVAQNVGGFPSKLSWIKDQDQLPRPYVRPWAANEDQPLVKSEEEAPVTSAAAGIAPKENDRVEVSKRLYTKILVVSQDKARVTLETFNGQEEPPFNGKLTILASDLKRVSNHIWRHVSGFQSRKNASKPVSVFSANDSWDSNYVMAPEGQMANDNDDMCTQRWSEIETGPSYDVVMDGLVLAQVVKLPRPLAPVRSVVSELVNSQSVNVLPSSKPFKELSLKEQMEEILGKKKPRVTPKLKEEQVAAVCVSSSAEERVKAAIEHAETTSKLFTKKAGYRPWHAVPDKPTFRISETNLLIEKQRQKNGTTRKNQSKPHSTTISSPIMLKSFSLPQL